MALRRIRVFLTYSRREVSLIQSGLSEAANLSFQPADLYPASVLQRRGY